MKFCFFLARLECLSLFASSEVDYKLQLVFGHATTQTSSHPLRELSSICCHIELWTELIQVLIRRLETFCQMCGEEKQTPLSPRQQLWKVCSLGKSQISHFNFDSGGIWKSWRHLYNISTDKLIIHVSWSTRGTPFVVSKCEMLQYIPLQDVFSDSGF